MDGTCTRRKSNVEEGAIVNVRTEYSEVDCQRRINIQSVLGSADHGMNPMKNPLEPSVILVVC
jgi:hypothetical protein